MIIRKYEQYEPEVNNDKVENEIQLDLKTLADAIIHTDRYYIDDIIQYRLNAPDTLLSELNINDTLEIISTCDGYNYFGGYKAYLWTTPFDNPCIVVFADMPKLNDISREQYISLFNDYSSYILGELEDEETAPYIVADISFIDYLKDIQTKSKDIFIVLDIEFETEEEKAFFKSLQHITA